MVNSGLLWFIFFCEIHQQIVSLLKSVLWMGTICYLERWHLVFNKRHSILHVHVAVCLMLVIKGASTSLLASSCFNW